MTQTTTGTWLADFPHWDESYAATLVSTDEFHVELDVNPSADGSLLEIRRTVIRKAHRSKDRHIVWMGVVGVIPREQAASFARDFVASLAA